MEPTTPEDWTRWAQLCEKATPGPWAFLKDGDPYLASLSETDHEYDDAGYVIESYPAEVLDCMCQGDDADEAFIAAAREIVPRLLADVRRLSSENTRLEAALENAKRIRTTRDQRYIEVKERAAELEAQAAGMTGQAVRMAARIEELENALATANGSQPGELDYLRKQASSMTNRVFCLEETLAHSDQVSEHRHKQWIAALARIEELENALARCINKERQIVDLATLAVQSNAILSRLLK